ncbi:MAG: pyrroline-5-carboxylate reductase [Synergistaceae bacterium]|nr:pyrroline-5-carboxylate reductase [Synergistaceae bacterium]
MIYGFIGLGNMASAIVQGMTRSEYFRKATLVGFDADTAKMQALAKQADLKPLASPVAVAQVADVVVLAVKPQILSSVLDEELKAILQGGEKLIVSIAAGKKIAWYEEILGKNIALVRVMPNLAAKVGAACSALCKNEKASKLQLEIAQKIFASIGTTHVIEEKLFSAFTALSGSSGAITLMYINAMATIGVNAGFTKDTALLIANEAVMGSSKLLSETGNRLMELQDAICSPAGTTIAGVLAAKKLGLESIILQSIQAIIDKDIDMAK